MVGVIRNSHSVDFASANNQAITQARGAYIALLNNDTWVEPEWLAHLVTVMEADAAIGMVASKMLYAAQPGVVNGTGICVDRCGITWERRTGEADDPAETTAFEVFGPSAGAGLYRRAMLETVGLFDEAFGFYLEDVDLAWRARWRGWRAMCAPAARVYHVHSGTMGEGSPRKMFYLSRNKIFLLVKNYPGRYGLIYLPALVGYELLSLLHAVWRGRGLSALRGRLSALRAVPRLWAQRQAIKARATTSAGAVWNQLEPARWPWQVYSQIAHLRSVKR
jgi:hypothetical protein